MNSDLVQTRRLGVVEECCGSCQLVKDEDIQRVLLTASLATCRSQETEKARMGC